MSDIAVRVVDLGKRFRRGAARHGSLVEMLRRQKNREYFWALKDVSFEVAEGRMLGIVGANGAGKSTLLRILSRITRPDEGRVDLYGRVSSLLDVGTGFHPELTGRENVSLNASLMGMKPAEIGRRFEQIVEFAEVGKFLDTPLKRYSAGMRARLGFAVAAHLDQEILLVDEVLAVGDAAFRDKVILKFNEMTDAGRTVILVGHNLSIISSVCDQVIWLDKSRIRTTGKAAHVIQEYLAETFSRQAVGDGYIRIADDARHENGRAARISFSHLRILNQRRQQVPFLTTGETGTLAIGYRAAEEVLGVDVCISVSILDRNQHCVAVCDNVVSGQPLKCHSTAGEFYCEFTRLPLMPAFYLLSATCRIGEKIETRIANAGQIQVIAGDFFPTGQLPTLGSCDCLMDHDWTDHHP